MSKFYGFRSNCNLKFSLNEIFYKLLVLTSSLYSIGIIIDSVLKFIIPGWDLFKSIYSIYILVYVLAKRSETPTVAETSI